MGLSSAQLAEYLNTARSEDLTNQMTDNSMLLRLLQKYASNAIQDIQNKYAPEKERIRSEIEGLDKKESRLEYEDLINELKELKDEEEAEIEAVEEAIAQKEEEMNLENDMLETQLEAVEADGEMIDGFLETAVQSFGYFQ